ncbi:MAG: hypothetical protein A4E58_02046 [Syntrophorhabdus sp. PtaB.Bin006]|nr:MAG: hypothetical protein A4E58_02046 [Syntrophorhabdus sp. PtaB.Bin006]
MEFSSTMLLSDNRANSPPISINVSVAMTPKPPAFVMIASRRPLGRYFESRTAAELKSPANSLTLMTPALLNAASYTWSSPAMAPVWDRAAFALSVNRPGFTMMIGLFRAKPRAALMNFLALPTPSI